MSRGTAVAAAVVVGVLAGAGTGNLLIGAVVAGVILVVAGMADRR